MQVQIVGVTRFVATMAAFGPTAARGQPTIGLEIGDRRLEPEELIVPAASPLVLMLRNGDAAQAVFACRELNLLQAVAPGGTCALQVGALAPGSYPFMSLVGRDRVRGMLVAVL